MAAAALLALIFSFWPPVRSGAQYPYPPGNPCDNCDSDGPTGGPGPCPPTDGGDDCEEDESENPGDSGDEENCEDDSGTGNNFSSYSGNAKRKITDIKVFGSVGMDPLSFTRYSNTRTSAVSINRGPFGKEGAWSHKYLWWMRDAASGTTPGVKVAFPAGADIQFLQDAADPNLWLPATDLSGRIVQSGDDFRMERNDGWLCHFKRYLNASNAHYYRIEAIDDSEGNRTTFSYNSVTDTTVRKVTDASGRFLQFSYTNLGPFLQQETQLGANTYGETAGVWNEITVTNTTAFRWLALFTVNDYHNAEAVPVAEVEFYDESNNLITGTPFYSDPVFATGNEGDKAFDADTATYYRYSQMRNGYVGLDCGTARQVSRIRYFIPSGVVTNTPAVRFVGLNNAATANNVISRVTSSDGRFVDYSYSVFEDASGWFKWALLNSVTYPDATVASYSYTQLHDFTQPLLTQAVDPRLEGRFVNVAYEFDLSTVLGFTKAEKSGLTGEVVASSDFDSAHKPKFVYPNGKVKKLQYGSNGRLQQTTNGNGGVTTYQYDGGTGYMTSKTDPLGRTTAFVRDAEARPTLTTLPDGTTIATTYDASGRVLAQTITSGAASRTTSHQYDASGRRTRTDHPDGSFETWTYNSFGQPLTHRQRNSGEESWTYSATGLKLSHTDAVGATTTYAYDTLDRLASMTDALGRTTAYARNDRGQVTQVTHANGAATASTYDDFGNLMAATDEAGHVTTFVWNEFKQRLSSTDPLGRTTTFEYAPAAGGASGSTCGGCNTAGKPTLITLPTGRKIRHEYDLEWNLLSTTVGHGTPEASTTAYRYNAAFKVDRITDPLGRFSYLTYDSRDRVLSFKDIRVLTTTFTYDGFGNRLTETQPGNRVTTFTYDAEDRLLTVTDPLGQTTTYAYDIGGNRVLTQLPSGRQLTAAYDLDNQVLQSTIGAGTADAASTVYAYDLVGNLVSETDPLGRATTYAYDQRNRRISTTDPLGRITQFAYSPDGLPTTTQFPDGSAETRAYDAAHQLIAVTDALNQTVQYGYDLDGRQTSLTDARGNTRTWSFDSVGRLTAKTYPDATAESQTYRADGTLATRTTPAGGVETYTYNAKGQLTLRDWSNATPDVSYIYDSNGRVTSMTSSDATVAWTYDVLDRKLTEKQTVQPMGTMKTVSYTYDADGRTSGITYPGSSKRNYTYTPRGQLAAVTLGTTFNPVASYAYNLAGETATLTRSNNLLTTYTHDAAGQLTALAHTRNGNAVDSLGYTLDAMGRRTAITRPSGKSDSYTYDLTGQVTGASYGTLPAGAGNETFAYDPAGNRTAATGNTAVPAVGVGGVPPTQSYTTNPLDQYTNVNGQTRTHGLDGNVLTMQLSSTAPIIQNGYDSENRMTSTQTSENTRIDNRYDPLHRRVLKQVSTWDSGSGTWVLQKTVRFTYDGWNMIEEEETTASATPIVRHTWGTDVSGTLQGAGGVGGLLRSDETIGTSATTTHYYWFDGNGNVTGLMRSNGTVDATHRYTAFGGKAESAITASTYAERNRYRFSTKYLDDEVEAVEGTYYYGYRHYLTALGRWGVRDPIGELDSSSLYLAVRNEFPNALDYLGLAGEKCSPATDTKAKIVGGSETLKNSAGSAVTPEEQADAQNLAKLGEKLAGAAVGNRGKSAQGTSEMGKKAADTIRDKQKQLQDQLKNMMNGEARYWNVDLKWECCKCKQGETEGTWTAMDPVSGDSDMFTQTKESSAKLKEAHTRALEKAECN